MNPRRYWHGLALCAAALPACGPRPPAPVSPADIPQLQASVAVDSNNGAAVLRLAAALLAADRCEEALPMARRGMELRPPDAMGALVAGHCLERRGDRDQAIAVYDDYVARYGANPGAPAVAARALLGRRAMATREAQRLVGSEAALSRGPIDPNVLAVMPMEVVGDTAYGALSVGIANLMTSDLALIPRFRLVERSRLDALLEELKLAGTAAVDPTTAARTGRLLQAGTIVQGVTLVPADQRIRLAVSLLDPSSRVTGGESVTGRLRDLLRLEKDLVIGIAGSLGYQLSEAERRAVLENGTQNLAAFLAYSRGLLDQNLGNYEAAALHFARAVRADPSFQQAREAHRATVAAPAVQQGGAQAAPALAGTTVGDPAQPTGAESAAGTASNGLVEVAPTQAERLGGGTAGQQATSTATSTPPPSTTGVVAQTVIFGFRFVLRVP
jgi:tetratricopeptide (TPR) repeat protein